MKLARLFALVAFTAALATNNAHSTSSTTLAVGAMILSLPFAQALTWYNQFIKDTFHANSNEVLSMCSDLKEREFASDLLPEEAKDLCALNLDKNMNHNDLVQAYEQTYRKGLKKYNNAVKQHEKALKKGKVQETSPQQRFEDFCQDTYNKAVNQLHNYHAISQFFPAKNTTKTETTNTESTTQEAFPKFYTFINTEISRINKGKKNAEISKEKSAVKRVGTPSTIASLVNAEAFFPSTNSHTLSVPSLYFISRPRKEMSALRPFLTFALTLVTSVSSSNACMLAGNDWCVRLGKLARKLPEKINDKASARKKIIACSFL